MSNNASSLPAPLRGIIPPMVTPLRSRDELDVAGLERLIEHILAGGVHGLFVLGTTGEAPSLSYRLRRDLVERACRQVAGNRDRVAALHEVVMQISDTIYSTGRHSSSYLKGLKCALAIEGICDDFLADPFHRFRDAERDRVRGYLAQVEPLVAEVVP